MPPSGSGQPWLWPISCRRKPNAPLTVVDGGSPECCADPASHAAARLSPSNRSRPSACTEPSSFLAHPGRSPRSPAANRIAGRTGGSGESTLWTSGSASGSIRFIASSHPAPALPSDATVASTPRSSAIALPSRNGCASTCSGSIQRRPSRSRASSRIAGEAAAIGAKPAQWSWTNPGSVISDDAVAPPGVGACSSTVTSMPWEARWIAATRPLCPAPTTRARFIISSYPRGNGVTPGVLRRAGADASGASGPLSRRRVTSRRPAG